MNPRNFITWTLKPQNLETLKTRFLGTFKLLNPEGLIPINLITLIPRNLITLKLRNLKNLILWKIIALNPHNPETLIPRYPNLETSKTWKI
jgi:hypothetical protein